MFIEYVRLQSGEFDLSSLTSGPAIWLIAGVVIVGILWTLKR